MHNTALYILVFLVSGSGFLTQTLVSGYWTSAFSDDILNYSLHLSVFFLSLGVGALAVDHLPSPKRRDVFRLGFIVCGWLGFAIPLLKYAIVFLGGRLWWPLLLLGLQGALVGSVVPLVLRVEKGNKGFSLGKLFFIDYISAFSLSCVFTFLLLVPLGYAKTGALASGVGLLVIALTWILDEKRLPKEVLLLLPVFGGLTFAIQKSGALTSIRKEAGRTSKVVLSKQSHYQKIVLMEESPNEASLQGDKQYVLYLDGFLQFASGDEQTYHACIANVPMMGYFDRGQTPKKVLILGGGDGLAARNVLLIPGISKVTLVELDPVMIEIAKNHPVMREQNLDSLRSPRLEIVTEDAFQWARRSQEKYDLVIIDFPLPKNLTLARLYAAEFYRSIFNLMTPEGIVAIQAGPSYAHEDRSFETLSKVTASILKTIENVGKRAWAYTSVMDNEAFVVASNSSEFDFAVIAKKNGMTDDKGFGQLCAYRETWKRPDVEVNSLNRLPIAGYMLDWIRTGNTAFFHYRGTSANFLPE